MLSLAVLNHCFFLSSACDLFSLSLSLSLCISLSLISLSIYPCRSYNLLTFFTLCHTSNSRIAFLKLSSNSHCYRDKKEARYFSYFAVLEKDKNNKPFDRLNVVSSLTSRRQFIHNGTVARDTVTSNICCEHPARVPLAWIKTSDISTPTVCHGSFLRLQFFNNGVSTSTGGFDAGGREAKNGTESFVPREFHPWKFHIARVDARNS